MARIVVRGDNRPPNHAHTPSPWWLLLPLAANADDSRPRTCEDAAGVGRRRGGHGDARAARRADDAGQRVAHRRRRPGRTRRQTSGRSAEPERRRVHPARQRRGEPDGHPLAGVDRRRRLRRVPGRGRQPARSVRWASAISTRCSSSTTNRPAPSRCCAARARRMYGASAVHGIVNLLTPRVARPGGLLGRHRRRLRFLQAPAARFRARTRRLGRRRLRRRHGRAGLARLFRRRRKPSSTCSPMARLAAAQLRLRAAGTVLNQETAGFIQGYNSYRTKTSRAAIRIPRHSATPRARASRRTMQRDNCFARDCRFELAGIYRRSRMDFIQHFLIGKPLRAQRADQLPGEQHAGDELLRGRARGASVAWMPRPPTRSSPNSSRDRPPTARPPPIAIRPAGFHYDYTVDSDTIGATLAVDWRFADAGRWPRALRTDRTTYDYDNHMIDGNTDAERHALPGGGCLYSRPADRSDNFDNVAPRITLSWQPAIVRCCTCQRLDRLPPARDDRDVPPAAPAVGGRPRQRRTGLARGRLEVPHCATSRCSTAVFAMKKNNVILRESNGFNVSDGSTTHRGVEYEARLRLHLVSRVAGGGHLCAPRIRLLARRRGRRNHRRRQRRRHRAAPAAQPRCRLHASTRRCSAALDVSFVDRYFLDAANTATYPGTRSGQPAGRLAPRPTSCAPACAIDNVFDTAYADRADFAFGNYRYFPARGRALFLSLDFATH